MKLVTEATEERDKFAGWCHVCEPHLRPLAMDALQSPFFAPVFAWKPQELRSCCACASDFCEYGAKECGLNDGIECGELHFVCRACLALIVEHEVEGELQKRNRLEGRICCPKSSFGECASCPFVDTELACMLPAQIFEKYLQSRMELLEQQKMVALEAMMEVHAHRT